MDVRWTIKEWGEPLSNEHYDDDIHILVQYNGRAKNKRQPKDFGSLSIKLARPKVQ
jgi:hypothetical protein